MIMALLFMLPCTGLKAQVSQGDYTDYHVHLQDSATVQLGYRMAEAFGEKSTRMDSLVLDADTIIERLNRAKFKKAWIISNAYWFGSPFVQVDNEYQEVKKQNDWIAEQASHYPGRLAAFMSINPLKPYALEEIQRCADSRHFTGLKIHFANSNINLFDTAQVSQLQKVFTLANKYHLVLLIHFRSDEDWNGKANAEILVKQLLPFAKETSVVLAHMSGWGEFDKPTDDALKVLIAYIHKNGAASKNLYFDASAILPLPGDEPPQSKSKESRDQSGVLNKRINQIGTDHILFGTDWPLIDIDPYIKLLDAALGTSVVQEVLRNKAGEN